MEIKKDRPQERPIVNLDFPSDTPTDIIQLAIFEYPSPCNNCVEQSICVEKYGEPCWMWEGWQQIINDHIKFKYLRMPKDLLEGMIEGMKKKHQEETTNA